MSFMRAPGIEPRPKSLSRTLKLYVYLETVCPQWTTNNIRARSGTVATLPNLAVYVHLNILMRLIPEAPSVNKLPLEA